MVKSMTGYGRGESLLEDKKIVTEIKSFNHRYRDISLKLPRRFSPLENQINTKCIHLVLRVTQQLFGPFSPAPFRIQSRIVSKGEQVVAREKDP